MTDFDPSKLFGDMGQLVQQAKEMQEKLARLQEELRHRTVQATVGGGMVDVEVNGQGELVSIRIDPQAVDPRDVQMLQDLIVAAVNQGTQRARALAEEEARKLTGLPIGQLGNLLGGLGSGGGT
jgi:DNA-binding YbaB/EbfC family protein